MKRIFNISFLPTLIIILLIIVGCDKKIERSGYVVDEQTNEPLQNVIIKKIHYRDQTKDTLREKILTDQNGYFYFGERSNKQLFVLSKSGYVNFSSFLTVENDTIKLERVTD